MSRLVETYASLPLGAVDASVIAIAERLNVAEVATLDRRHVTVVRPAHTASLVLLPEELRTAARIEPLLLTARVASWPAP